MVFLSNDSKEKNTFLAEQDDVSEYIGSGRMTKVLDRVQSEG